MSGSSRSESDSFRLSWRERGGGLCLFDTAARWIALSLLCLLASTICHADDFEFKLNDLPNTSYLDRWMYPFNITPGSRIQAPTFGALGSEGFDERDGQFLIALNTAELGITQGLPPQQYRVNSATLTLTETFGGYSYDPTYDAFQTYLDPESVNFLEDEDEGRPIELFGVGFRGEFTELGWPDGAATEAPAFGSANSMGSGGGRGKRVRSVFAADAAGQDVSNNVDSLADGVSGFDTSPFAIARMMKDDVELEPGETVSVRTQWVFDIDVEDTAIQSYLATALSAGQLGLTVTSLHTTGVQGTGDPFPNPATANHFAFDGPVLSLNVDIVAGLLGDFDGDSALAARDVDLLSAAIREASADQAFDQALDLTNDGLLTTADREEWLSLSGTLLGDADFNGEVAFPDFLALSQNFGQAGGWAQGDFDGSGDVTFPDFLSLSQNFGQVAAMTASVPEPSGMPLGLILVVALRIRFQSVNKQI